MQAVTEPMGSAHLLDLAEQEREFLHFLQEKDLALMEAAAWLFRIYRCLMT